MDFTHSSRKGWRLLRHLGEASLPVKTKSSIDPNKIASVIASNSTMILPDKSFKCEMKKKLRKLKDSLDTNTEFDRPFTPEELDTAINSIKLGKAAGLDGLYPEFLKKLGKRPKLWVLKFLNQILKLSKLPPLLMKSNIIAILKPGKCAEDPTKYRPIALLSTMYKLLERVIYNRIKYQVDSKLPADEAGFRENRSCVEQLLTLTSHIEAGFEQNLKTALALVDLSSAYDTIWRTGFMWKFYTVIPCKGLGRLVNQMLSNRIFRVFINDRSSRPRRINNGFPQGSVCAPTYFNLYTSDMPPTRSTKFSFADDLGLATQVKTFEMGEENLEHDLHIMKAYYIKWCLCLNEGKTEVTMFHLNNSMATRQLNVYLDGERLEHNVSPKYLGLPLDRSLSFKLAMEQRAEKLKVRNNLIQKLAGSNWGSSGNVLRTAVLTLVFSAAEYASPVWYGCNHTDKVDVQLNVAMRVITGAVDSTPVPWLHVLSNIEPPQVRRKLAAHKEWEKCLDESRTYELPIKNFLLNPPPPRLSSRSPIWKDTEIQDPNFNAHEQWKNYWNGSPDFSNKHLIEEPHRKLEGFNLPRREWRMLNRFRSGHGCSGEQMHRWQFRDSPYCDCGNNVVQSMEHILNECRSRKFNGNINTLHSANAGAISWLSGLDIEI